MKKSKTHIMEILALHAGGKILITLENLPAGIWGGNDYDDDGDEDPPSIMISKKLCLNSKIKTLIHESLHVLYRSGSEKWVRAREEETYRTLSKFNRKKLETLLRKNGRIQQHEQVEQKRREARWRAKKIASKR